MSQKIESLKELAKVSEAKKCVVVPETYMSQPRPAAFVLSMQARLVLRLMEAGMFVYEKKDRRKP